MIRRRTFIASAGTTAALTAFVPSLDSKAFGLDANDPYFAKIGLQLYTLRNQMQADANQTLDAVAAAGYKQVELMDAMDATKLVPMAKDKGMNVTSAFLKWNLLGEAKPPADAGTLEQVIETSHRHGLKYLVFGYIGKGHREKADQLRAIADRSNKAGEKCQAAGIQLCYHHHSFEFQPLDGSKTGMDIFIEEFDKKLCQFEIDVFWAAIGGWDPIQTIQKLSGRVAQVHLKDLVPKSPIIFDEGQVPKEAFKEVGNGSIDMKQVIAVSKAAGVTQCHVEQDQSPDPLHSVRQSIDFLSKL